jgi:hypothetical protein
VESRPRVPMAAQVRWSDEERSCDDGDRGDNGGGKRGPRSGPGLARGFPAESVDKLPEFILGTMLVRQQDSNDWRVVTLWRSLGDLEECIKSVATPGAKAPSRLLASSQRSPCGARIAFSSIRDPNATRRPPCAAQIT